MSDLHCVAEGCRFVHALFPWALLVVMAGAAVFVASLAVFGVVEVVRSIKRFVRSNGI